MEKTRIPIVMISYKDIEDQKYHSKDGSKTELQAGLILVRLWCNLVDWYKSNKERAFQLYWRQFNLHIKASLSQNGTAPFFP